MRQYDVRRTTVSPYFPGAANKCTTPGRSPAEHACDQPFSSSAANCSASAISSTVLALKNGSSGVAGQLRAQAIGSQVHIYGDTDGDLRADLHIIASGTQILATDFIL